jgi:hypothetical protein
MNQAVQSGRLIDYMRKKSHNTAVASFLDCHGLLMEKPKDNPCQGLLKGTVSRDFLFYFKNLVRK